MSLSLSLPTADMVDWRPINWAINYKSIFRTAPAVALAKAGPAIAEAFTLLAVFAGIFSLFLGLAVI